MLEIRSHCESCKIDLPPHSSKAMICSFECTFCVDCVEGKLQNICPNCGGGFQKRPVRPKAKLEKYPPKNSFNLKPYSREAHQNYLKQYKNIDAEKR